MELEFVFNEVLRLGVHKNIFELLAVNEFLSNIKNYLRFCCISISCFSIFSIIFFLLMKILNNSTWRKIHSMKSSEMVIKRCFCQFVGGIFMYERWFMKQCVRVALNVWERLWGFLRCMNSQQLILLKFWVIKVLMWSIYWYHGMCAYMDMWVNDKILVTYGFHSW